MGAFQLLHMDRIPAHAVLNESVELCRAAGQPHAAGMVNAVLRKLARHRSRARAFFESPAALAERLAHPHWLVDRWVAAYGRDAALAICEYDQREPAGGRFSEGAGVRPAVMDDGSRLVAEMAAAARLTRSGCGTRAAPGGKTAMLAQRLSRAEILATDASAKRLSQMEGAASLSAGGSGVRSVPKADAFGCRERLG